MYVYICIYLSIYIYIYMYIQPSLPVWTTRLQTGRLCSGAGQGCKIHDGRTRFVAVVVIAVLSKTNKAP